jgi:amidase
MLSDKTTGRISSNKGQSQKKAGVQFFETPMEKYQLDAILSINNNNSGHAAAVNYPYHDPYGLQSNRRTMGTYL